MFEIMNLRFMSEMEVGERVGKQREIEGGAIVETIDLCNCKYCCISIDMD